MTRMYRLALVTFLSGVAACSAEKGGEEVPIATGGSTSAGTGGRTNGAGGNVVAAGGSGGAVSPGAGGTTASGGAGAPATGGSATDGGQSGDATNGGETGPGPSAAGYQFGARPQQYPPGSIRPTGDQGALDAVVKAAYDKWKAAYVVPACDGFVVKVAGGRTTTSSALGHGMIITAMMAGHDPQAQATFDGMFAVARKFPSILSISVPAKHGIGPRPGNGALVAFAIGANCTKVPEGDSAPDGDLALGYALLLADKQWGSAGKVNYLDEAKKTANAIKLYDMNPRKLPGLGDWASLPDEDPWTNAATPPNYTVGHFRAFAKASGDAYWMEAVTATQTSIADIQSKFSPMTGLFPQVLVGSQTLPGNTYLSDITNARDHFNDASYVPLWLAADYIGSGDAKSKQALTKITDWLKTKTGGDASKIVDGYRLSGDNIGSTGSMTYVAPFGAVAAFDAGNQAWLDAIWKLMAAATTANQGADTSNLLGMLMVTGNWWQP